MGSPCYQQVQKTSKFGFHFGQGEWTKRENEFVGRLGESKLQIPIHQNSNKFSERKSTI